MSKTKKTLMWVHPDFHKKLKVEAAKKGMSLLPFTRILANSEDEIIRAEKPPQGIFKLRKKQNEKVKFF